MLDIFIEPQERNMQVLWVQTEMLTQVVNSLQRMCQSSSQRSYLKGHPQQAPRACPEAQEVCALGAGNASELLVLSTRPVSCCIPTNAQQQARAALSHFVLP